MSYNLIKNRLGKWKSLTLPPLTPTPTPLAPEGNLTLRQGLEIKTTKQHFLHFVTVTFTWINTSNTWAYDSELSFTTNNIFEHKIKLMNNYNLSGIPGFIELIFR